MAPVGSRLGWRSSNEALAALYYGVRGLKALEQDEITVVRKLFNKLPFTWVEGGTEGRDYFAFMDVPILSFHECVAFIENES